MAVTTNLNLNTKSNGKLTEMSLNIILLFFFYSHLVFKGQTVLYSDRRALDSDYSVPCAITGEQNEKKTVSFRE